MSVIDDLKNFGADVETGLSRCINNEAFYIKMIKMGVSDERFEKLKSVLDEKNYDEAFEIVHALKGMIGNLALNPIYEPICKMTELLRSRTDTDYSELYDEILSKRSEILKIMEE